MAARSCGGLANGSAVDFAGERRFYPWVTVIASGETARRKVGGTVPHDLGGPDTDPFYRPNRYHYQDVSAWMSQYGPALRRYFLKKVGPAGPLTRKDSAISCMISVGFVAPNEVLTPSSLTRSCNCPIVRLM